MGDKTHFDVSVIEPDRQPSQLCGGHGYHELTHRVDCVDCEHCLARLRARACMEQIVPGSAPVVVGAGPGIEVNIWQGAQSGDWLADIRCPAPQWDTVAMTELLDRVRGFLRAMNNGRATTLSGSLEPGQPTGHIRLGPA